MKVNKSAYAAWFVVIALVVITVMMAQDQDTSGTTPITAENITQLQPITQIDYDALDPDAGAFPTGHHKIDASGENIAMTNADGVIVVLDHDGEVVQYSLGEGDPMALAFASESILSVRDTGDELTVIKQPLDGSEATTNTYATTAVAQEAWAGDESLWLELLDDTNTRRIVNVAFDLLTLPLEVDYAPADDPDVLIPVGRIPVPHEVTTSAEGVVKLWNMETGMLRREATVENGPAVFGQINAGATVFAWRNPQSETLNLLDFDSGENRVIAPLDGDYVQAFFVTPDASVILGVNIAFEPVVIAWIVETGERINLGEYRECDRVPDQYRLSADGTTLTIGCDTGLDIWQIAADETG